ncbi:MAG: putative transposase [Gammaproteobacteria bacterium]|jgi:transposase InsO family protein|nr:putative transposase [Gammaproteobacteria bacterium]
MLKASGILIDLVIEVLRWLRLTFRSSQSIQAENLFLRRQLALYIERGEKPRRIDPATRIFLTLLSRFFDWRGALTVVRPTTLIRWHRAGWKLFWRLKSRPGQPPIPAQLQALIRRISDENPSWGEERIANELLLKLGIRVSPRTVNKYLPRPPRGRPRGDLRWSTFLRLHAQGIIACDFLLAVTATFRLLYVFVVIEHHSRRLIHCNVTAHPSATWTLQQLREAIGFEERYEYLLHDRDSIFAKHLDESIERLGVKVLRSPPRSPKANAVCERVIGTIRRECLDWLIPVSEHHLRRILKSWIRHYNGGRPHMSLGPGIPELPAITTVPAPSSRHRRGESYAVRAASILDGLHHEYSLMPAGV